MVDTNVAATAVMKIAFIVGVLGFFVLQGRAKKTTGGGGKHAKAKRESVNLQAFTTGQWKTILNFMGTEQHIHSQLEQLKRQYPGSAVRAVGSRTGMMYDIIS
jgi:hypothetical protein